MGIILGLGAALGWGIADFCARFASQRIGSYRTLLYMQPLGFLGLSFFLILTEANKFSSWQLWALGLAVVLSLGNLLAGLSLYRAFEIGTLSLMSPIAASYGAITLLLSILSGERPSFVQLFGLMLTLSGVILASASPFAPETGQALELKKEKAMGKKRLSRGVGYAIFASLCFGVALWGFHFVTPTLGGVAPVWVSRLVGPLLLLSLSRPLGQSIALPQGGVWKWVIAVGLIDTLAFLCFTFGINVAGETGIVAVLSSLFSVITILLARLFLKERLAFSQWAGIGLLLLGVGLVSYQS